MHETRDVVFFAGGGTGGHLYPALALADALGSLRPGLRAVFVGAERGIEARILPERRLEHVLLPVRGLRRGGSVGENAAVVWALLRSMATLADRFQRLRPELVVVTGGYAGAPAGLMAALTGVPLALQEQNAIPGVTTRLLSRFADQIHVAFPEAAADLPSRARSRVRFAGNPIRPPTERDAEADRRVFGLDPHRPVVLVVGGSQGSRALNEAFVDLARARRATPPSWQVLWSTGPTHLADVRTALADLDAPEWIVPLGYIDDMPAALSAADLAVSRAGAMATSEFLAWTVPMVLVPLPTAAADHQAVNARALAEAGAAICLPESELEGAGLAAVLDDLIDTPHRLDTLRAAAGSRGRPGSAVDIARHLETLLPPRAGGAS